MLILIYKGTTWNRRGGEGVGWGRGGSAITAPFYIEEGEGREGISRREGGVIGGPFSKTLKPIPKAVRTKEEESSKLRTEFMAFLLRVTVWVGGGWEFGGGSGRGGGHR